MIRKSFSSIAALVAALFVLNGMPVAEAQIPLFEDFGDAPDSYEDTGPGGPAASAARHTITLPPSWMGDVILGFDPDGAKVASPDASYDDCHTVEGGLIPIPICDPRLTENLTDNNNFILDDEDGVAMSGFRPGGNAIITVNMTNDAFFSAWIDFDGDGVFDDPGYPAADPTHPASASNTPAENLLNAAPVDGGINIFVVPIPASINAATTFARFRVATVAAQVDLPIGAAGSGEVEDYIFGINSDFGDAPDDVNNPNDFPTQIASNGASHETSPTATTPAFFGRVLDNDNDGQQNADATGDDVTDGTDDEDGLTVEGPFVQGDQNAINLEVTGTGGEVDAWIDWNRDNDWADAGEQIFDDQPVNNGDNPFSINVPANAVSGGSFARFRISQDGVASFTGHAPDGEVEDYGPGVIQIGAPSGSLDFGDAANTYSTTTSVNGPRHLITSPAQNRRTLGFNIDGESDGQPSADSGADDRNGNPDDEDGVRFRGGSFSPGQQATVDVTAPNGGWVDAWLDANRDGVFDDPGEHVISQFHDGDPDEQPMTFTVPPATSQNSFGPQVMRFRISSSGANSPRGFLADGEVEDYGSFAGTPESQLQCGSTVGPGEFILDRDLNCPGDGPNPNGLFVGDSRTTIDLNGHTISGDGIGDDSGISMADGVNQTDDVTIMNGEVVDFGTGIETVGHHLVILNTRVGRNHGPGVLFDGENFLLDEGSVVDLNEAGGVVGEGGDAVVRDSTVRENSAQGVQIDGRNARVLESRVDANTDNGVSIVGEHAQVLDNISVSDNGGDGIRTDGNFPQIVGNQAVNNNALDGIHVLSGRRILITRNTVLGNGDDGIDVERAAKGRKVSKNILKRRNGNRAIEAHRKVHGRRNRGGPCKPVSLCNR